MTRFRVALIFLLVCLAAVPAVAQNRVDLQLMADVRMLHEEMQRLQLSLNAVVDQIKTTNSRIDAQAEEVRKGFANEGVAIGEIRSSVRTIGERENESMVNVSRLTQEMKSIRDGLTVQNTMLNSIISLLQTPPDPNAVTRPSEPGAPAGPPPTAATPPPTGGSIPPSPSTYYSAAFGYYAATKYDDAILMANEALAKFPDSPDAPRAQMTIGDSYVNLGKNKEALEAYTTLIDKYKTSDQLPDAYYKQGQAYAALGQRENARRSYQYVIKNYPQETAATLAAQALKKLGGN
jgi:tol-pal system protein YbgF